MAHSMIVKSLIGSVTIGAFIGAVVTVGGCFHAQNLADHTAAAATPVVPLQVAAHPAPHADDNGLIGSNVVAHAPIGETLQQYCIDCHNPTKKKGKLDLQSLLNDDVQDNRKVWQEVQAAMLHREMPPEDEPEAPRPPDVEYDAAVAWLTEALGPADAPVVAHGSHRHLDVLDQHCTKCHSDDDPEGGLDIEVLLTAPLEQNPDQWEKIIRKMNARQMPPQGKRWPDPKTYAAVIDFLQTSMDEVATKATNPGRTSTFRRLTRREYENAVRDLLALDIDASSHLPRDEVSHGFDNITVTKLSPTLMDRYLVAAQKIARAAVGSPMPNPGGETIRVPPDMTQDRHIPGLPLGTRGGTAIDHHFPRSGSYEIEVTLTRDRNERVEGLGNNHNIYVLLNRELIQTFEVKKPSGKVSHHDDVDKDLSLRVDVPAGQHEVVVTFEPENPDVLEQRRKPHQSSFNFHRHPRRAPAVYQVSIIGPFDDQGVADTASRQQIFGAALNKAGAATAEAEKILKRLARHAYRRPITALDIKPLMDFYRAGSQDGGFEAGIELAVSGILVNPNFLFRIEREPSRASTGTVYRISDFELASRLAFFLWGSLPDEELLAIAESGELHKPAVLRAQTERMLKDQRSSALTDDFAGQWLYLRNLDSTAPDNRAYPDFDDNLRQAMRRETELLFEHVLREDLSVLELITANYTFLNERIAKHYDMAGVYGSRFRKVDLPANSQRGGLLRHGSVLSVTSYPNRTSPVIRGAWILENIIGAPPPPPPPDVPALDNEIIDENLPIRERLAAHSKDPSCAGCHNLMDPVGFALEHYDAIGQYRYLDNGLKVDSLGKIADGTTFYGVQDLEAFIARHPENFVRNVVEKLMTFGLGRGVESFDMPVVRQIVAEARNHNYAFSSLIVGLVQSHTFQHRIVE